MPREVTILTLLQEIRYLKQELAKTPELHWLGLDQWLSTRPMAREGVYSSDTELLPQSRPQTLHTDASSSLVSPRSN